MKPESHTEHFQHLNDMNQWLEDHNIETSHWGDDGTKSVDYLWQEYNRGEITFELDPPLRLVRVTQVVVRRDTAVLIEAEQELGSGQRRYRNQLPAEKMKPGETAVDTAVRCLHEELGVDSTQIEILPTGGQRQTVLLDSPSYPGLMTRYTFYTVEAAVSGLPVTDFWRDNAGFNDGDPVRRHHWIWRRI